MCGIVSAVTHDEASAQRCVLRTAKKVVQKEKLGGSWESFICSAHRLQTCLNHAFDGVPEVQEMVAACRKLVGHFRHSAKATSALLAAQGSVKHACVQLERLELGQAKDQQ